LSGSDANVVTPLRYAQSDGGTGPVKIRRDAGFFGLINNCDMGVSVDGVVSAYIKPGDGVTLNLPAGERIIGVQMTSFCPGVLMEQALDVTAGRSMALRVSYDYQNGFALTRTVDR
jgi:hypothetical protein